MIASYFFGYGSLVNHDTHPYQDVHLARLRGWRRTWRHTPLRPLAFLSAEPQPDCDIEGVIAHVPDNNWSALDEREYAYDRIIATTAVIHPKSEPIEVAVYSVPKHEHAAPDDCHPILLSYLDVVVQGYLRAFGEAGVARFFDTTTGWSVPVLNDRGAPQYPRHRPLTASETQLVDYHLHQLEVRTIF